MQKVKTSGLQRKILKTLVYSDIFDFPLTSREVWKYLIDGNEVESKVVQETLKIFADSKRICSDGEYFFLKGRNNIVDLRKEREEWSKEKWKIAQSTANRLKIISTIKMIGITGALAMNNCEIDDDIDLLIITSQNSLWLTRLLLVLGTPFLGINRRKPNDRDVNNKICFNLFLDEDHFKIEPENLFLAHEIAQVKVISDKGGIYEGFIKENEWVEKYLPNAFEKSKIKNQRSKPKIKTQNFISLIVGFFNEFFYKLQLWYMKPKMTIEKVNLYQAFFHPGNISKIIEKRYEEKISKLASLYRMT